MLRESPDHRSSKASWRLAIVFLLSFCGQSELISQDIVSTSHKKVFHDLSSGLSQRNVNSIIQDHRGFVWIGTDDGLNKFDGYSYSMYRHNPSDNSSINNSLIRSIIEDGTDGLWIGTERGGLIHYDFKSDEFESFDAILADDIRLSNSTIYDLVIDVTNRIWVATNHGIILFDPLTRTFQPQNSLPPELISNDIRILDLFVDAESSLWIGTDGKGLWRYNKQKKELDHFDEKEEENLIGKSVRAVYQTHNGELWVGTDKGLSQYSYEDRIFSKFPDLNNNDVWSLSENAENELVIGTDGGGLNILTGSGKMVTFLHDDLDAHSISDNVIRKLYRDHQNNLWVGMFRGGVNLLHSQTKKFLSFGKGDNALNNGSVLSFARQGSKGLWIGTDGGGINYFNRTDGSFSYNPVSKLNWDSETDEVVLSTLVDRDGGLWTGTYKGGLKYYPQNSSKVVRFLADESDLINNSVLALHQDKNGDVWIGTNGGINYFDWEEKKLKKLDKTSYMSLIDNENSVRTIYGDAHDDIWFGVVGGLKKINLRNRAIHEYAFEGYYSNYLTYSIHEDQEGHFWVGTFGGGLLFFDPKTGVIDSYGIEDGLPSDIIYGILEDQNKNLWLSTGSGISKFNVEKKTFRNYDIKDGLQGNQYNRGAFFEDESGYFWFGGTNGMNVFHPDSIYDNAFVPSVVFTNLKIVNQKVSHRDSAGYISSHINAANSIDLDYAHSVVTIEFASLNFVYSERSQYAFKLEGFDRDWRYTSNPREATYTNLNPGSYSFRVKSTNNDGIWNEQAATIGIIVHPPWWRTWLAYSLYVILIGIILFWARKFIVDRERQKINRKLEHLELTHLQEMDHMKSKFFANISHELRTPLTLILDPLKLMYDREAHPKVQKQLKTMIRNAQRLVRLINQLLDLSKLETGNMQLEGKYSDLVQWLKHILPAFSTYAGQHNIKFNIVLPPKPVITFFDQDKLEKVVSNLLSNALKFTRDNGFIDITVKNVMKGELPYSPNSELQDWIEIKVEDNGVGIPNDRIQFVFDRFYQVDGAHHREQEGTGIGLSLTKELVELHQGQIFVESIEGQGTKVAVFIPIVAESEPYSDQNVSQPMPDQQRLYNQLESTVRRNPSNRTDVKAGKNAPLLLVVEDNTDVSAYICSQLGENFRIKEASNGKIGLENALQFLPDLIISDVMMPIMDGIEMTTQLKTDQRTSHIPIILLTAKAEEEDVFKGVGTGADDYMVKPFDSRLLGVKVKNLIESREKLKDTFANNRVIDLEPKEITATPVDELFLKKALESVEQNMDNSNYSVEDFGNDVGLSRMQLYRKLKALTDQSPNEFIRTVRLKRAAQLIHVDQMTISQITYEVGFNDLQYFRDCFKKHFGVNPSDYGRKASQVAIQSQK